MRLMMLAALIAGGMIGGGCSYPRYFTPMLGTETVRVEFPGVREARIMELDAMVDDGWVGGFWVSDEYMKYMMRLSSDENN